MKGEKGVNAVYRCHVCGVDVVISDPVGRKDACPGCGADLRCCMNCRHYEATAYNRCRESQADRVLEKERANFCDYFRFQEVKPNAGETPAAPMRDRWDALFKK